MIEQDLYRSINKINNKIFLLSFLIFVLTSLTSASMVLYIYLNESDSTVKEIERSEKTNLAVMEDMVNYKMGRVIKDLNILSSFNSLRFYLDSKSDIFRRQAEGEFRSFSNISGSYDQIRFIDEKGLEKIRVDYEYGTTAVISQNRLQDKSARYYFKESIKLNKNELYVSPFDLNVEGGIVEVPFRPMLRFAKPVFDSNGKRRGIVVVNYAAKDVITRLEKISESSSGQVMMLNMEGYWLKGKVAEDEWGFMLPERDSKKFGNEFTEEWNAIKSSESGQITTENGIFTYITVNPLQNSIDNGSISRLMSSNENNYKWKIVQHIPNNLIKMYRLKSNKSTITAMTLIFVVSFLPSLIFTYIFFRKRLLEEMMTTGENYDYLTRLPNRSAFYNHLEETSKQSAAYHKSFALLLIDINNMKNINKDYGLKTTNTLIYRYSKELIELKSNRCFLAKLKSVDFGIIVKDVKSTEEIEEVANRIYSSTSEGLVINGREINISVNIGAAIYPDDSFEPYDLVKKAKVALKKSKEFGTSRFTLFESCLKD